jgi:hypothetical protein
MGRRGGVAPQVVTLTQRFVALFEANDGRYEAVSGSNILTDQVDGSRTLAVGSGVVANAAADADYGGKPSLALTGTQYLESNQATSFWPSLHNGAGATFILVHRVTAADSADRYLFSTCNASTGQNGITCLARGPATSITGVYVCNASGGFAHAGDPFGATVLTPTYLDFSITSGANGLVIRRKSSTLYTATLGGPSASSPERTLRIGANSAASGQLTVRSVYHWRRVLTAAERSIVQAYILADSGLAP